MTSQARHRRRWLRWTAVILLALVVVVVGGTSIYVHLSTAPAALTLPKNAGPEPSGSSDGATVDGVWNAGQGSIVGWRAEQVLIGQQSTLVGRTGRVWGSITISGGTVSQGSFTVDMAALTSGESQSTQRSVFDVSAHPTATLALTGPIALGTIPLDGAVQRYPAAGTLRVHGSTHAVHFTISAERVGSSISVLADINFPFVDWNISVQGVPFLADIQSPAIVEVLLNLSKGTGNLATATTPIEPSRIGQ
jgi:polyisoprenoid-binding protein YceI